MRTARAVDYERLCRDQGEQIAALRSQVAKAYRTREAVYHEAVSARHALRETVRTGKITAQRRHRAVKELLTLLRLAHVSGPADAIREAANTVAELYGVRFDA